MVGGLPDDVVSALRHGQPAFFCHVTPAAHLPDIAASGGLLSSARRGATSDRWGANLDRGKYLVCCGFRPHYGVLKHFRNEESVLLLFDAPWLAGLPGATLSPHNTATIAARGHLDGDRRTTVETLQRCRADKGSAEILVPDAIPLDGLRYVVFCDREARDAWWPVVAPALPISGRPEVRLNGALGGYRLPRDLAIDVRHRPVRPGVDRRRRFALPTSPIPLSKTVALEDALGAWDDEDGDEGPDLFDTLYGGRREHADFIDWPVDDDEPLYDEG